MILYLVKLVLHETQSVWSYFLIFEMKITFFLFRLFLLILTLNIFNSHYCWLFHRFMLIFHLCCLIFSTWAIIKICVGILSVFFQNGFAYVHLPLEIIFIFLSGPFWLTLVQKCLVFIFMHHKICISGIGYFLHKIDVYLFNFWLGPRVSFFLFLYFFFFRH